MQMQMWTAAARKLRFKPNIARDSGPLSPLSFSNAFMPRRKSKCHGGTVFDMVRRDKYVAGAQ